MAELWEGLWPGWGPRVQTGRVAPNRSTAPGAEPTVLWSHGDALWQASHRLTRGGPYFSPIPSTTPITTDPYL